MFWRKKKQVKLTESEVKILCLALCRYKWQVERSISAIDNNMQIEGRGDINRVLQKEKEEINSILSKIQQATRGN